LSPLGRRRSEIRIDQVNAFADKLVRYKANGGKFCKSAWHRNNLCSNRCADFLDESELFPGYRLQAKYADDEIGIFRYAFHREGNLK